MTEFAVSANGGSIGDDRTQARAVRWRPLVAFARRPAACIATGVALALVALYVGGLLRFVATIPGVVADPISRTDAIVVLTGGRDRFTTGLRLLADDKAERVFVSGVNPSVDLQRLVRLANPVAPPEEERVDAGYDARDTAGNALETAAWMRRHGYRSLRLVTAHYHMPRSLLEFGHVLPGATVIPHPVAPRQITLDGWWRQPDIAALIVGEYNKFLLAWLAHRVEGWLATAAGFDG